LLLEGKRLVITGVLTDDSIAFSVARLAQEEGAEIILTSFGRPMRVTQRAARLLPQPPDVLELDVTKPSDFTALAGELDRRWGRVDGVLHAIAFAPETCLGGNFLDAPWTDVSTALQVSTFSLKALAQATLPLFPAAGGSIVGLDFDSRCAWPFYDWMGVAKAGLEATARYLARAAGPKKVRVNLVAAGPVDTMAARAIPGVREGLRDVFDNRAPLGWAPSCAEPVARACVALLSDWFPATTGEIVHVDGGFHAVAL
jgi:meromycolic acid enoyl-[acyl-carrier-protein] reductase